MNKIRQLLKEWRDAQPLDASLQRRFDQAFMVDFNYNSYHLEGNTLTYGQTKLLLLFGIIKGEALFRDSEEMKAHNVGLEMIKVEALDKERPLSEIRFYCANDKGTSKNYTFITIVIAGLIRNPLITRGC